MLPMPKDDNASPLLVLRLQPQPTHNEGSRTVRVSGFEALLFATGQRDPSRRR
jgi:hypothetical protein